MPCDFLYRGSATIQEITPCVLTEHLVHIPPLASANSKKSKETRNYTHRSFAEHDLLRRVILCVFATLQYVTLDFGPIQWARGNCAIKRSVAARPGPKRMSWTVADLVEGRPAEELNLVRNPTATPTSFKFLGVFSAPGGSSDVPVSTQYARCCGVP